MTLIGRKFLVGFGLGMAFTLVVLKIFSYYVEDTLVSAAQPALLRPFMQPQPAKAPKPSKLLPKAWFPKTANPLDDNWKVRGLDGKYVSLAELRGKVVFLNFWSAACAPCIDQMSGIERLYTSLRNESVAFLVVTNDSDQPVRNFLGANEINVPVYFRKDMPGDFPDEGMPLTIILDRSGAIVFKEMGAKNWDDDNARNYIRSLEDLRPQ
jgi:peroxiredoxin